MALRKSKLTPQYAWDTKAKQYRHLRTGAFVSRAVIRGALDDYLEAKRLEIRALGEQLQRREISTASFQKASERLMAQAHLAGAALSKGGWAQLDQSDYGRVGSLVRSELKYFYQMLRQMEAGLPLDGRFLQRLEQYAEVGRHTYHVFDTLEQEAAGNDLERSVRGISDSCYECIAQEQLGWQFIAKKRIKEPGDRVCKRKCKCRKEFAKSIDIAGSADAVQSFSRKRDERAREILLEIEKSRGRGKKNQPEPDMLGFEEKFKRWGAGTVDKGTADLIPRKAFDKLRKNTRDGANEALFLIDRNTGAVVDHKVGGSNEVSWSMEAYRAHSNLLIVHSHPDKTGPSGRDWSVALNRKNFQEFVIVGQEKVFVLRRPPNWKMPKDAGTEPEKYFDYVVDAIEGRIFIENPNISSSSARQRAVEETNKLFVIEYNVQLDEYPVSEWYKRSREVNRKRRKRKL